MSDRDQNIVERISRAEKDLLEFKNAQTFGKDVTKPKVIQRFNSDGTPTDHDIEGTFHDFGGGFVVWQVGGTVTYTARNQESPWATVYAHVRVNPNDDILPGGPGIYVSFNAYVDFDELFNGGKSIKFGVYGGAGPLYGPPTDPTVDRFWAKLYVLATDYGDMKLEFPTGANKDGVVVPLT